MDERSTFRTVDNIDDALYYIRSASAVFVGVNVDGDNTHYFEVTKKEARYVLAQFEMDDAINATVIEYPDHHTISIG